MRLAELDHMRFLTRDSACIELPLGCIPQANYGKWDKGCTEKVKAVYESLNLRQLYAEYEEQSYQNSGKLINEYSDVLPAPVFLELRDRIYKREK